MATYTPNYNLKKPEPVDFYDVADMNGNTDVLDQQIKLVADRVEEVAAVADLNAHIAAAMPHRFTDTTTSKIYHWGMSAENGVAVFNFEEVV